MILTILLSTLGWLLHSIFNAIAQAFYYDLYPKDKGHKNIHWLYTLTRGVLFLFILWNLWYDLGWGLSGVYGFCLCCIYSFFHNGVYYYTRNFLNEKVYPKGFFDSSETSEALIETGLFMRTALAVLGFIGIGLIIIS